MTAQANLTPIAPNPAVSGQLSLDARKYTGTYYNGLVGNIFIRLSGGYLAFDWDDLPQLIKSTGMDTFSAHDSNMDAGTQCGFLVSNGDVKGIDVTIGGEKVRFDRKC